MTYTQSHTHAQTAQREIGGAVHLPYLPLLMTPSRATPKDNDSIQ